ncbi:acyltransferase family protein [Burkholderia diffusa]|uniref:acyltransferase family protein n=1 Tax=Burkholderia diffusa TaxID=488732 RepID=UPI0008416133|nr:acyltransferase [Burkholderia diffusa]AOI57446.1 hypothetical protein WI26_07420 [Burkholderia diffusa]
MGTFRLLLALLVVASHTGVTVNGHNPGVFAVVSFFLMSGYVTTALIEKYYASVQQLPMFALDRALRLFPQFLFYLGAGIALAKIFHIQDWNLTELNAWTALLNALMLPTGYYMYLIPHALVLPPSWSLGLEFTFYAAFPFVLLFRLRGVACICSLAFFAYALTGHLDPDVFGYRLLPGTLFMFIAGSYIRTERLQETAAIWCVALAMIAMWIGFPNYRIGYNIEILAGIVAGIPVVYFLSRMKTGRIDQIAGNLSYGVYLNHYVLIYVEMIIGVSVHSWVHRAAFMATSISLAAVSYYFVERPAIAIRYRMRGAPRIEAQAVGG